MNTAHHCTGLGRPLMAVPGPVTSAMSVGCHTLIAADTDSARLVTGLDDVLLTIGSASDLPVNPSVPSRSDLTSRLDQLDQPARQVFDGFPARGWVHPDRLAVRTGLSPLTVIRALPILELSGLIEVSDGGYRIVRPVSRSPSTQST
jgi:DNA processing protein